jgi:hypothetical protein
MTVETPAWHSRRCFGVRSVRSVRERIGLARGRAALCSEGRRLDACGGSSHRRRWFNASTDSFPLDRPVPVATRGRRWQVDFRGRAFPHRSKAFAGRRRNTGYSTGKPEGCRTYPTDRILGGDRRGASRERGLRPPLGRRVRLHSRWEHRVDRGTGRAGGTVCSAAAQRRAGGDIGNAGSSCGRRRSPTSIRRGGELGRGGRALTSIASRVPSGRVIVQSPLATGCLHLDARGSRTQMETCRNSTVVDDVATCRVVPSVATPTGMCSREPFVPTNGGASLTRAVGCLRTRGTRS